MKTKISTIVLALLAGTGITFGSPSVAHADFSDCPVNRFCAWDGNGGEGTRWTFSTAFGVRECINLTNPTTGSSGTGNNRWDSWKNRLPNTLYVYAYEHRDCNNLSGDSITLAPGRDDTLPTHIDNEISSFMMAP